VIKLKDLLYEERTRFYSSYTILPKNLTVIFDSKERLGQYKSGDTLVYQDVNNKKMYFIVQSPMTKINSSSLSSEEKVRYKDVYKQLKDKGYSGKSIDWMLRVKKK